MGSLPLECSATKRKLYIYAVCKSRAENNICIAENSYYYAVPGVCLFYT